MPSRTSSRSVARKRASLRAKRMALWKQVQDTLLRSAWPFRCVCCNFRQHTQWKKCGAAAFEFRKKQIQIAFSSAVVLACIWVCTCMCMYACTHTRTYMHACTLGLLYLHAFAYARACACTHPSTMSAIFLTLCLCMCGHNTRSLALRKHFWLKLDPTSLQDFSLSDLHHACRHEVREGYENGQEACSRLRMQ